MILRYSIYLGLLLLITIGGAISIRWCGKVVKLLWLLVLLTFLSELASRILAFTIKNSYPPYHILCLVRYLITTAIVRSHLQNTTAYFRLIPLIFLLGMITISTLELTVWGAWTSFPTIPILVSSVLHILWSLILIDKMKGISAEEAIWRSPIFWFVGGNFSFFSMSFLIFGYLKFFPEANFPNILLDILYAANLLSYAMYGFAIFVDAHNNYKIKISSPEKPPVPPGKNTE